MVADPGCGVLYLPLDDGEVGALSTEAAPMKVKLVSTEELREMKKQPLSNLPTESILGKAHRAVHQERGPLYGHPLDNHSTTAQMFAAYLNRKYGHDLTLDAEDVCFLNILQKVSREAHEPAEDNLTDIAGYAHNVELIRAKRQNTPQKPL